MQVFQQHFWGYEVSYPEDWVHAAHGDVEAFGMHEQALDLNYDGKGMGYLLIRCELNPYQSPIAPLWSKYLARVAVMHSAKNVGSSPFRVGNMEGFEAELVLPRRENKRLWVGILSAGGILLHLMVLHRKTEFDAFQPIVSGMVSSLRFAESVSDLRVTPRGMPIPKGSVSAPAEEIFPEAESLAPYTESWDAFRTDAPIDALQIFYLREAPVHGWELLAYSPFPGKSPETTYATLVTRKEDGGGAAIHLVPAGEGDASLPQGHIVIQYLKKG